MDHLANNAFDDDEQVLLFLNHRNIDHLFLLRLMMKLFVSLWHTSLP